MPVNQSYPDILLEQGDWLDVVVAVPALSGKEITVQALGKPLRVAYSSSAVEPSSPLQGHLLFEHDHITAQAAHVWVRAIHEGSTPIAVSGTDPA